MYALKMRSNWLLKLRIAFAIYLQEICAGFACENDVLVAGGQELYSSFCAISCHYFSVFYNEYSAQCRWLAFDITLPLCSSVNIQHHDQSNIFVRART